MAKQLVEDLNNLPMKAKEIQDLIDFIAKSGLEEVNIETEAFKIKVKRSQDVKQIVTEVMAAPAARPAAAPAQAAAVSAPATAAAPTGGDETKLVAIKSPMIGTFYRSSNPESAPFAKVGDKVKVGQAVCIIEAMKLFNEIESEVSGTIVKMLVDNATPVEYDQPLFLVDPSK